MSSRVGQLFLLDVVDERSRPRKRSYLVVGPYDGPVLAGVASWSCACLECPHFGLIPIGERELSRYEREGKRL